jgi:hypothetical protein
MRLTGKVTLSAVAIVILAVCGWPIVSRARYVYPAPEHQSAFFRSYAPSRVIEAFGCKQCTSVFSSPRQAGAGRKFVSLQASWNREFVMKIGDQPGLMAALRQDILFGLAQTGAHLMHDPEEAQVQDLTQGFQMRYHSDRANGIVAVEPVRQGDPRLLRSSQTQEGMESVQVKVRIAERWFRSGEDTANGGWPQLQ